MDKNVDEAVSGVDRSWHGAVGHGAGGVESSACLERGGGRLSGVVVGPERVISDQIAVESIADLFDGGAGRSPPAKSAFRACAKAWIR